MEGMGGLYDPRLGLEYSDLIANSRGQDNQTGGRIVDQRMANNPSWQQSLGTILSGAGQVAGAIGGASAGFSNGNRSSRRNLRPGDEGYGVYQ